MPDSVSQWSSYAGELGETDRVIRFVVNSGQRDRNGNLIDLATASLSEFSANPIVTWLHDHHSPPAGRCVAVWLDKGLLWADIEFLPTTEGNFLYRYYSNGWLRGVSAEHAATNLDAGVNRRHQRQKPQINLGGRPPCAGTERPQRFNLDHLGNHPRRLPEKPRQLS